MISFCKKCVTPITRPRIHFNNKGICNACLNAEKKKEIDCSIGTFSLSCIDYYLKKYKDPQPNSFFLMNNTITFPCFEGLEVQKVINAISSSLK